MDLEKSLKLIEKRPALILLLALPYFNHLFLLTKSALLLKSNFILSIIGTLFIPAIYGLYLEDIKGNKSTLLIEFKKHIGTYLITIITIHSPLILLSIILLVLKVSPYFLTLLATIIIKSATIYVLPLVFITSSIYKSITDGIMFTMITAKENQGLVFLAILSAILIILSNGLLYFIFKEIDIMTSFLSFVFGFVSAFLSCVIFITACSRLKETAMNE